MQKIVLILSFIAIITGNSLAQDANRGNPQQRVINEILQKGTQVQKDSLAKTFIDAAKKATAETELRQYYNYLNNMKKADEAAVVLKKATKLYPQGKMARDKDISKYYELTGLKEKELQYQEILKKYPIKNYPDDGIVYDYVTSALAKELVKDGQKEKGLRYLDNMQEEFWRAQGYFPIAEELLKQGDTAMALPLIEKSVQDALKFIRSEVQDNKAKFAAVGYPQYAQTYADLLLAKGKYKEALASLEDARSIVPNRAAEFRPAYARALQMVGRDLEAFNEFTALYREGQFNYYAPIENLYLKLNKGQRTGLDGYIKEQQETLKQNISKHVAQIMTSKETPAFKLRNLTGEVVDSKSLIGKVVVLDFWATWCQPCVRSFPGMQKAVTKYQNDPDVVFLFIDTWERDANYEQKVKEFIQKNNYSFNVLFDDKKTDSEIAPQFGIKGIPAKFVIDKKGNTRFFLTGSSPYVDYIVMELTEMIELARKG